MLNIYSIHEDIVNEVFFKPRFHILITLSQKQMSSRHRKSHPTNQRPTFERQNKETDLLKIF